MFPGFTATQLFEIPPRHERAREVGLSDQAGEELQLVTSAAELSAALAEVVREATDCLVAVGSRSREPSYLLEIEEALRRRPRVVHYRILIGPPHSQLFKDHLLRLIDLRGSAATGRHGKTLHISMVQDPLTEHERFFAASDRGAVVILPSANSPANFDTGLFVRGGAYVQSLVQHGKALYGRRRLETADAVDELPVLR
jgi:hypothetical protein